MRARARPKQAHHEYDRRLWGSLEPHPPHLPPAGDARRQARLFPEQSTGTFTSAPHVEFAMPTISMFYGIVIYLYFFDDERHKLPHIHAKYHGQDASFSIIDGALLSGDLPHSKVRLVQA